MTLDAMHDDFRGESDPFYDQLEQAPWLLDAARMNEFQRWTDGVIVADADGQLVYANDRAIQLHGHVALGAVPDDYSVQHGLFTMEGRPYPPDDLPLTRAVTAHRRVRNARWRIRRPDGAIIAVIGDAIPLRDRQHSYAGAIMFFRPLDEAASA